MEFGDFPIILESKESPKQILKRRAKRLGVMQVIGQLAFVLLVVPILRRKSARRLRQIVRKDGLDLSREIFSNAFRVDSVNGADVEALLRKCQPDIVVVNGTRIISKRILAATPAKFINIHCGITPMYRGTHGGYWARVSQDDQNCGVTVHLVDAGVDTGRIFWQKIIKTDKSDNIITYPLLQVSAALPVLIEVIKGNMRDLPAIGDSNIWFHPTIWGYLYSGLKRGVW
jgi:folate-dependent phosphoribosylglycinamide formyltransferase PurN